MCIGPFVLIVAGAHTSLPTRSELGGVFGELGHVLFQGTGLEQLFLIIVHRFLLSLSSVSYRF